MVKHLRFIFAGIILSSFSGWSQANAYFNNNPCWQIQSMCQVATNCFKVDYFNYFINGDSLIGTNIYKKVYSKGSGNLQYFAMGPPPAGNPCLTPSPTSTLATLSFFIRSAGKKMYVYMSSTIGDTLLYDFNLNVGDTLPPTYNNYSGNIIKVTGIDSVNTTNGWMKRFQLSGNTTSTHLVEGMGHYKGLIEPIPPNVMSCGWTLQCYSQNNTAYYPSAGPSCLLSTDIKRNNIADKPFVFPNPSSGSFQIKVNEVSKAGKIEIYNIAGQLILSFTPEKEISELDLSKEKPGIYFLRYISEGETRSVKLIKE